MLCRELNNVYYNNKFLNLRKSQKRRKTSTQDIKNFNLKMAIRGRESVVVDEMLGAWNNENVAIS